MMSLFDDDMTIEQAEDLLGIHGYYTKGDVDWRVKLAMRADPSRRREIALASAIMKAKVHARIMGESV